MKKTSGPNKIHDMLTIKNRSALVMLCTIVLTSLAHAGGQVYTLFGLDQKREFASKVISGKGDDKVEILNDEYRAAKSACYDHIFQNFPDTTTGGVLQKIDELVNGNNPNYRVLHEECVKKTTELDQYLMEKYGNYRNEYQRIWIDREKPLPQNQATIDYLSSLKQKSDSSMEAPKTPEQWALFLESLNLVFTHPISDDWGKSILIADGFTGAMINRPKDKPWALRWKLGRADVSSEFVVPGQSTIAERVPVGDFFLKTSDPVIDSKISTDIWNGEVRFSLKTRSSVISGRSFVERTTNVIVVAFDGSLLDCENGVEPEWSIPYRQLSAASQNKISKANLPPKPIKSLEGDIELTTQLLTRHGAHATALLRDEKQGVCYIAIGKTYMPELSQDENLRMAKEEAIKKVRNANELGLVNLTQRNRSWWHNYMSQSWISLPDDPLWEVFYWQQIYKFGAASHPDKPIIMDLLGPWYIETKWAACWWNLNVQLQYFPAFTANRLDAGKSMITALDHFYDQGVLHSKKFPEAITIGRNSDYHSRGGSTGELGNLTWALHNYWRYWKFSMDDNIGKQLFKILRADMNYYIAVMTINKDGGIELPKMISPEYKPYDFKSQKHLDVNTKNTTYAHTCFRWGLNTLIQMNKEFGFMDPLEDTWKKTLKDLIPVPTDQYGYRISSEHPFAVSHRHYSHLLDLYPFHVILPEDGKDKEALFRTSLEHFVGQDEMITAFGWSGASPMYAVLGDGEMAYKSLMNSLAPRYSKVFGGGITENAMYNEDGNPCMETPFALVDAINYMLLQSMRGVIRVFPAVPRCWQNVSFKDLRTEGAFLISAERNNGRTQWIEIESLAGEKCVIEVDFEKLSTDQHNKLEKISGPGGKDRYQIDIIKGGKIRITNMD